MSLKVVNVIGLAHHRLHEGVAILIDDALLIESSERHLTLAELLHRVYQAVPLPMESFCFLEEFLPVLFQALLKHLHFFHLLPGALSLGRVLHQIGPLPL
jgi:hypothetical protein